MKKLMIALMALLLIFGMTAQADKVMLERSGALCEETNCYVTAVSGGYRLFTAAGEAISDVYRSITVKQDGMYLEVQNVSASEQLNCLGLLDAAGREILPMAYGDFYMEYNNPDWVLAYVLGPAAGDTGEYKDSNGNQYIITRTDVVYKGKIIGSLGREDYTKAATVGTRGSYLYVRPNKNQIFWLDSAFNRVDVTKDISITEYTSIYKQGVMHNPTQTYAFTAGCTLTADMVEQTVWYDSTKGVLLDLQGNVLAADLDWDYMYFKKNYLMVKRNGLYGIADLQGNVIVPLQYKEIAASDALGMFATGYNALVDEKGRLSYVDETGAVTASVDYELSYSDYKGFTYNAPIVAVKNMGKYMLISATHGQLEGLYDDVITPKDGHTVVAVKQGDVWGCIGMDGSVAVPFELRYSPSISNDGTLVLGTDMDRNYAIYRLGSPKAASTVPASWTETEVSGEDVADDTPVLADGAWQCTCGVITNGKFCPECGSKKPEATPTPEPNPAAEDGSWTCDCGAVNTGKFCPECGARKPEATPVPTPVPDPQCVSCGYKPEGAVPKFCPECGTKF